MTLFSLVSSLGLAGGEGGYMEAACGVLQLVLLFFLLRFDEGTSTCMSPDATAEQSKHEIDK